MANEREIVHSEAAPYNSGGRVLRPQPRQRARRRGCGFVLEVGGLVATPLRLTLADLGRFPQRTVDATLQCAGNRRAEM